MILLAVLAWIAAGCLTVNWVTRRQGEDTDYYIIAFVVIYFGVPLLLSGVLQ